MDQKNFIYKAKQIFSDCLMSRNKDAFGLDTKLGELFLLTMQEAEKNKKPPLGIEPRCTFNDSILIRLKDIEDASDRYIKAGFEVPEEWNVEHEELLRIVIK